MSGLLDVVNLIRELFGDLFVYSYVKGSFAHWVGLAAIVLMACLTFFFSRRFRGGQYPILRGIDGVFDLRRNVEMAAESGKAVHFSIGTGSLGDAQSLQTLAGLDVLQEVGARTALSGPPLIATTAGAMALPVLQSTVRSAYAESSFEEGNRAENSRLVAPTPLAYAAGVTRIFADEDVNLNVMVGSFGDEYLFIGEVGVERGAKQMVAAAEPTVMPFVIATADYPVIGEELFALSSYFRPSAARIASIMAQDVVRLLIVALIFVLVIVASFSPEFRQAVSGWALAPGYP